MADFDSKGSSSEAPVEKAEHGITREAARVIVEASVARAVNIGQVVAVAVLDGEGRTVSADRMDGTKMNREAMATGKAWAAVMLEEPTSEASKDAATEAKFFSLLAMFPGKLYVSSGGGVPLIVDGRTVGAVGVAGGDKAGADDEICEAGLSAWAGWRENTADTSAQ